MILGGFKMNILKSHLYGFDLGYNYLKDAKEIETVDAEGKPKKEVRNHDIISVVEQQSSVATDLEKAGYHITMEDGTTWTVGAKGNYDLTASRLTSEVDLPKMYTLLGLFAEETGAKTIDFAVTGLPVSEYMAQKKVLKEKVEGVHKFKFMGRDYKVEVKKAQVIPQAAGAYYDYFFTDDGMINPERADLMGSKVLVLDIGGRTSDAVIMEDGKYDESSFTVYEAMINLQQELRRLIQNKYHFPATDYELDRFLRARKIIFGRTTEDISGLIKEALQTRFPNLRNQLITNIGDFRHFSAVLLCGGGAYYYKPLIERLVRETSHGFDVPVILMPKPQFSNANGYLKFAKMVWQTS